VPDLAGPIEIDVVVRVGNRFGFAKFTILKPGKVPGGEVIPADQ
jgi:hypothetical protein